MSKKFNIPSRWRSWSLFASGVAAVLAIAACGRMGASTDSHPLWLASEGMSDAEVESALKASMAIRVNLTTNRATLYQQGEPRDQWNIASADVTGQYHNGQPKFTPEGIYGVEDFEHCPVWRPRDPINPATGKVVQSEEERWQVFNAQPEIYGPCGARNPLGRYVFWFHGPFGMHGNSAEEILRLEDPEDRRVSGGCLRNPNAKIRELFHLALTSFPEIAEFKQRVVEMETNPEKQTVAQSVRGLNMRVVVGSWRVDPQVKGGSLPPVVVTPQPPVPTPTPIPEPIGPAMICKTIAVDSATGVAPVHRTLPATNENVSAYYRMNDPIRVHGLIPGTSFYRTGRGFIDQRFVGYCSNL